MTTAASIYLLLNFSPNQPGTLVDQRGGKLRRVEDTVQATESYLDSHQRANQRQQGNRSLPLLPKSSELGGGEVVQVPQPSRDVPPVSRKSDRQQLR